MPRSLSPERGLVAALALCVSAAGASAETPCVAVPGHERAVFIPVREPGVQPSQTDVAAGIDALPEGAIEALAEQVEGEALLYLPKDEDGTIPTDFELAPGARVAASYWSALLCATIARISGEAGEELVTRVPERAEVFPNSLYASAAAAVSEVAEPPRGDPYRRFQYALDLADVDAARDLLQGPPARIAVLDSAPARDHDELGALRISPIEGVPQDPAFHGTLIAGVIGAAADNGFGIAGLAPSAELTAVPVCVPRGRGLTDLCTLYDMLQGFDRSAEIDAQVVNLSVVGPPNGLLERITQRLSEIGTLVIASSGNEGGDAARYPAAYPAVLGVASLRPDRRFDLRSNRGPSANLWAPGVEILSTLPGNRFAFGDGSSLAAAHVSALSGLAIAATGKPYAVREALLRDPDPRIPSLCEILARAGSPCRTP